MSNEPSRNGHGPNDPPDADLLRSLWQEARDLVKRLEGSTVRRLSVQARGYRIEIERYPAGALSPPSASPTVLSESSQETADGRLPIVAPLLGSFYRSPQPGAKPFVEVGDLVDKGQTVAIIEAMKIMNQIPSPDRGRIVEIVAKDHEWVEFEQVLMFLGPVEG